MTQTLYILSLHFRLYFVYVLSFLCLYKPVGLTVNFYFICHILYRYLYGIFKQNMCNQNYMAVVVVCLEAYFPASGI